MAASDALIKDSLERFCDCTLQSEQFVEFSSCLFSRKERCLCYTDYQTLIKETEDTIAKCITRKNYALCVVLRAHQSDHYYGSSGHAKLESGGNSTDVQELLSAAVKQAEDAREYYEQWRGQMHSQTYTQCAVWVNCFYAMAHLCNREAGSAETYLKKAGKAMEKLGRSDESRGGPLKTKRPGPAVATSSDFLLEKAFLHNCYGRYYRDFHAQCHKRSSTHSPTKKEGSKPTAGDGPACARKGSRSVSIDCSCKASAIDNFRLCYRMLLRLSHRSGRKQSLFEDQIILMKINIVRTLLNNPDDPISCEHDPGEEDLNEATEIMQEVRMLLEKQNTLNRIKFRYEIIDALLIYKRSCHEANVVIQKTQDEGKYTLCSSCIQVLKNVQEKFAKVRKLIEHYKEVYGGFFRELGRSDKVLEILRLSSLNIQQRLCKGRQRTRSKNSDSTLNNNGSSTSEHTEGATAQAKSRPCSGRKKNPSESDKYAKTAGDLTCVCGNSIDLSEEFEQVALRDSSDDDSADPQTSSSRSDSSDMCVNTTIESEPGNGVSSTADSRDPTQNSVSVGSRDPTQHSVSVGSRDPTQHSVSVGSTDPTQHSVVHFSPSQQELCPPTGLLESVTVKKTRSPSSKTSTEESDSWNN